MDPITAINQEFVRQLTHHWQDTTVTPRRQKSEAGDWRQAIVDRLRGLTSAALVTLATRIHQPAQEVRTEQ